MFMAGPNRIRAAATVHSSSSSEGSGWCCMAVWGLALCAESVTHMNMDAWIHVYMCTWIHVFMS